MRASVSFEALVAVTDDQLGRHDIPCPTYDWSNDDSVVVRQQAIAVVIERDEPAGGAP
jgi:hypothetical protein